ncbi:UDP-2,3-diacylglucosamine diphosphatase [Legionella israelensis]|uniref:UDP-2,3-diacylglucosamine hydrolase n=1 Tax=Legionella israelensis TaxID=454 RepID=A0A0W0W3G2_9GAMM|nr:UDP-2,3-diacylglucosamine diphosphatase [Legionella israelensis]KTD26858.1 UDP-2,3-diacylglucosamine hydrolase [Legionella israelensis]QBS08526.1 UDP-2,3-diacylglucosamine diphosphatase [Legionella israelensis]SCX76680.1 UDP-2,3-diacylglucosamine hydrolase [Legionella israelensis DSM 19235]STX58176.1 UDP-2,3-diacylglucosamine hydrolase [Legionella israelensis]
MIAAVFISDLHLSPDEPDISRRFDHFLLWAQQHSVKTIYILGDFFHAWPGDDGIDEWCKEIAKKIKSLSSKGILFYYMHGNRDFLLGKQFAKLAGWTMIDEPALIDCGEEKVMLAHGDGYCTQDVHHQRFRRLTRNRWFKRFFLFLPYFLRIRLVKAVRQRSQSNRKPIEAMDVVEEAFLSHMQQISVNTLIHGHTHKPGVHQYEKNNRLFRRYVLSDWDDRPQLLCYDKSKGFYFNQLSLEAE